VNVINYSKNFMGNIQEAGQQQKAGSTDKGSTFWVLLKNISLAAHKKQLSPQPPQSLARKEGMQKVLPVLLFLNIAFAAGCYKEPPYEGFSGWGKRPVYISQAALRDIRNLPPRSIVESGPIFLRDTLFFMLERKQGIHVFSLQGTQDKNRLTFFSIPGADDFSIAGSRLYAAAWTDLVTIDISDLYQIKEVNRQSGVFQPILFPLFYRGPFECVDETKGVVLRWEEALIKDARCTVN
jgi:hypothetical protein